MVDGHLKYLIRGGVYIQQAVMSLWVLVEELEATRLVYILRVEKFLSVEQMQQLFIE